jgi:signal transduction histidine kinase
MTISARLSPPPDQPGAGLSGLIPDPRLRAAVSLAGLAVSLWVTVAGLAPHAGNAILAALAVAGLAWLVLAVARGGLIVTAALIVMGAAGGVVASGGSGGLIFTGLAASGAAAAFGLVTAAGLAAVSPAACVLATLADGTLPGRLLASVTVSLLGLVAGYGRREIVQRARQDALVATAEQRAAVAREEAELAGERNRLGRELHDVLAHTLGALSIQLTALDTLARGSARRQELIDHIERSHELVGTGLDEARQAVRALRDDTVPLDARLARLSEAHGAALAVSGTTRQLSAEASLAVYRLVQEALTNAGRHAPGAAVSVRLCAAGGRVTVTVRNAPASGATPSRTEGAGGGFGLRGMRERVLGAGGQLAAGPTDDGGWQVSATIPGDREQGDGEPDA